MPVFRFGCPACGTVRECLASPNEVIPCECGEVLMREFTPGATLRLASWLRTDAEEGRARQRAWMDTDEVKAKLRSGEYQIDTSDRHNDNADGAHTTSSITARAEMGRSLSV